jgi:hypothetical protein
MRASDGDDRTRIDADERPPGPDSRERHDQQTLSPAKAINPRGS